MRNFEFFFSQLVSDLSVAQILSEKINKMFLPKRLGFIDVLSTVGLWKSGIKWRSIFSFKEHNLLLPKCILLGYLSHLRSYQVYYQRFLLEMTYSYQGNWHFSWNRVRLNIPGSVYFFFNIWIVFYLVNVPRPYG